MKTINNKNTIKTEIKRIFLTIKCLELALGRKIAVSAQGNSSENPN